MKNILNIIFVFIILIASYIIVEQISRYHYVYLYESKIQLSEHDLSYQLQLLEFFGTERALKLAELPLSNSIYEFYTLALNNGRIFGKAPDPESTDLISVSKCNNIACAQIWYSSREIESEINHTRYMVTSILGFVGLWACMIKLYIKCARLEKIIVRMSQRVQMLKSGILPGKNNGPHN